MFLVILTLNSHSLGMLVYEKDLVLRPTESWRVGVLKVVVLVTQSFRVLIFGKI